MANCLQGARANAASGLVNKRSEYLSPLEPSPVDDSNSTEYLHKAMDVGRIFFQNRRKDQEAVDYLETRDFSHAALYKFQIGFAPRKGRDLVEHYSFHKTRLAAKEAGLITTAGESARLVDFFRNRIMFPIRNPNGDLIGFAGRLIGDGEAPKYINTPETAVFHKGKVLYGLFENRESIAKAGAAIVVEGYTDVIRMYDNGIGLGVAPMGTAFTPDQLVALQEAGAHKITFCFDGDKAGDKAAARTLDIVMANYRPEIEIFIARLPSPHDPDTMIRQEGAAAFKAVIQMAAPLGEFIHQQCITGHRLPPSMDDQAEYLTRVKPFLSSASGHLYSGLMAEACLYTALSPDTLNGLMPNDAFNDHQASWDRTTTLAARWLVNDFGQQQGIAGKFAPITLKSLGLGDLVDLAKQYVAKVKPTGPLYEFARAHGPISQAEIQELRQNWQPWMKRATLEEGLQNIAANPMSENAKKTIRMALS